MRELQTNNLKMVDNMRYGGERYQNSILTDAVFDHKATKDFIKNIVEDFKDKIGNNKGNLNKIKLEAKDLTTPLVFNLKRPNEWSNHCVKRYLGVSSNHYKI